MSPIRFLKSFVLLMLASHIFCTGMELRSRIIPKNHQASTIQKNDRRGVIRLHSTRNIESCPSSKRVRRDSTSSESAWSHESQCGSSNCLSMIQHSDNDTTARRPKQDPCDAVIREMKEENNIEANQFHGNSDHKKSIPCYSNLNAESREDPHQIPQDTALESGNTEDKQQLNIVKEQKRPSEKTPENQEARSEEDQCNQADISSESTFETMSMISSISNQSPKQGYNSDYTPDTSQSTSSTESINELDETSFINDSLSQNMVLDGSLSLNLENDSSEILLKRRRGPLTRQRRQDYRNSNDDSTNKSAIRKYLELLKGLKTQIEEMRKIQVENERIFSKRLDRIQTEIKHSKKHMEFCFKMIKKITSAKIIRKPRKSRQRPAKSDVCAHCDRTVGENPLIHENEKGLCENKNFTNEKHDLRPLHPNNSANGNPETSDQHLLQSFQEFYGKLSNYFQSDPRSHPLIHQKPTDDTKIGNCNPLEHSDGRLESLALSNGFLEAQSATHSLEVACRFSNLEESRKLYDKSQSDLNTPVNITDTKDGSENSQNNNRYISEFSPGCHSDYSHGETNNSNNNSHIDPVYTNNLNVGTTKPYSSASEGLNGTFDTNDTFNPNNIHRTNTTVASSQLFSSQRSLHQHESAKLRHHERNSLGSRYITYVDSANTVSTSTPEALSLNTTCPNSRYSYDSSVRPFTRGPNVLPPEATPNSIGSNANLHQFVPNHGFSGQTHRNGQLPYHFDQSNNGTELMKIANNHLAPYRMYVPQTHSSGNTSFPCSSIGNVPVESQQQGIQNSTASELNRAPIPPIPEHCAQILKSNDVTISNLAQPTHNQGQMPETLGHPFQTGFTDNLDPGYSQQQGFPTPSNPQYPFQSNGTSQTGLMHHDGLPQTSEVSTIQSNRPAYYTQGTHTARNAHQIGLNMNHLQQQSGNSAFASNQALFNSSNIYTHQREQRLNTTHPIISSFNQTTQTRSTNSLDHTHQSRAFQPHSSDQANIYTPNPYLNAYTNWQQ